MKSANRAAERDLGVGTPGSRAFAERKWDGAAPDSIEALQVVYKIAERCNINCSYCYYFNMGDETPLTRPKLASLDVTDQLARWIAQGCKELRIPHAKISFHGGEPTLIGVEAFDAACRRLREIIEPTARVSLSIQTNGTLIDERWIEQFVKHAVGVGVSIDGPQSANDRFRLDHRGHSTFGRTEHAIRHLVERQRDGGPRPSTISVLHHGNDYRDIYRYLRGMGVTELNFLLPDRNADDTELEAAGYGTCLSDILLEWLEEDDLNVHIKFIDQMLSHFRRDHVPGQAFKHQKKTNQVVVARSDGTVAVDDTFIPALDWYKHAPVYSTSHTTLQEFLKNPVFSEIETINNTVPGACASCRWRKACRGGDLENRFSSKNGFDNPSVYCDGYKVLYSDACEMLVQNGYPVDLIAAKFGSS